MLDDIRKELDRLAADEIAIALDDGYQPDTGTLLRIEREIANWHMLPEHFLELLRELPDGAGADQIHRAIERTAVCVWHGPALLDDRDLPL